MRMRGAAPAAAPAAPAAPSPGVPTAVCLRVTHNQAKHFHMNAAEACLWLACSAAVAAVAVIRLLLTAAVVILDCA
jgi:hypothetical protein